MPPGQRACTIGTYKVDEGFFDAMGLKLMAGRWFDRSRPIDDMTSLPLEKPTRGRSLARRQRRRSTICGEEAGLQSPQDASARW